MRKAYVPIVALIALAALNVALTPLRAQDDEKVRAVAGGGITATGWQGKVDAGEAAKGAKLTDAKFAGSGANFQFHTGPAVTYWNPANTASGSYTVKASFKEPKYMNLNDHPHPYGIVIGGNDMGTDNMSALYCSAYGSGTFIVRGFGPAPFAASERRPTANAAIHKAAAAGEPVNQEIAVKVTPDKVECIINGASVGSYAKTDLVGAGKLKSLDGVYGLRFAHNTEGEVSGFAMSKN